MGSILQKNANTVCFLLIQFMGRKENKNVLQNDIQNDILFLKGGVTMAMKTANVIARVEPDIKEQAEKIMEQLGIPTSVLINMLYKQIIMKKGIPFSVTLVNEPKAVNEMCKAEFDSMMEKGLQQAKEGNTRPAREVFAELRQEI